MSSVSRIIRDAVIFACIGSVVALLDALHVYTDTLSYPRNTWFFTWTRQPIWVPFLFGGSGILLGFGHRMVVGSTMPKASLRKVITHGAVFCCAYAASGFLKRHPYVLAVIYLLLYLRLMRPIWKRISGGVQGRVAVIFYFLSVFAAGPLVEAFISSTGRFSYESNSKHLHGLVPVWLPPLYLTVGLTVSSLDSFLCGEATKHKVK
jgi:hypothetical protein